MESRDYFEKIMQDYNQNRNGRSLRKNYKPLPKDNGEGQKEVA